MPVFFEKRDIVTPGDLLAEGDYFAGDNTYKEGDKLYATRLGIVDVAEKTVGVVALKAFYSPKVGDTVIGKVVELTIAGWLIDINAPQQAMLRASEVFERDYKPQRNDLPSVFDIGDLIIAKIIAYDRTRDPQLTIREPGLGKVTRGQVVEITPTKIPRVIGRKGSMISMIKEQTGCHIVLGQNGVILISGKSPENEHLAMMAIRKIEEESHTSGLTDRITEMLKKLKGSDENASKGTRETETN
ncbi:MAG: exosome complex RNA-binding protein Rrp4 [Candidatus Bathyarchaeales archaeon]